MRFPLVLAFAALGSALPAWPKGPIISDDDTLMERRDIVKIEIIRAESAGLHDTIITRITRYASDARDYLTDSFKGAVADGNGDILAASHGKTTSLVFGEGFVDGHRPHHHRHRISLLGFRNRLAIFILAFSVVFAMACSYLRRSVTYV